MKRREDDDGVDDLVKGPRPWGWRSSTAGLGTSCSWGGRASRTANKTLHVPLIDKPRPVGEKGIQLCERGELGRDRRACHQAEAQPLAVTTHRQERVLCERRRQ